MLNLPQNPKWGIARVSHSTLVNADCFDVFPFIEDNSIDAIICDLPYGTTKCKWDNILPFDLLWKQYNRILKQNGVVILFGNEPFSSVQRLSNIEKFKYDIIWIKDKPANFLQGKIRPLSYTEMISVFGNSNITYNPQMQPREAKNKRKNKLESSLLKCEFIGYNEKIDTYQDRLLSGTNDFIYPRNYQFFGKRGKSNHPTEKPIDLMEWIIKTYTNEGDTVLDNTMGSGTTNLACLKLNRKSIGIEKEKQYYDVAVRRLSSYCG